MVGKLPYENHPLASAFFMVRATGLTNLVLRAMNISSPLQRSAKLQMLRICEVLRQFIG
jgi:hypothetical protein